MQIMWCFVSILGDNWPYKNDLTANNIILLLIDSTLKMSVIISNLF